MNFYDFKLSKSQMLDVANAFEAALVKGLNAEKQALKCLPAYTPINHQDYSGEVCVLDLGGSNLRASKVVLDNNRLCSIDEISEKLMPWQRGVNFDKSDYLGIQAKLIKPYLSSLSLLGYCFSYPTNSLEGGDAELVGWTKGVQVNHMLNQPVGSELADFIHLTYGDIITNIAVINDTVASLLAGLTLTQCDAYFSIVVGTGFNSSGLYPTKSISKLTLSIKEKYNAVKLPVNLESGNFIPPHLSIFDSEVDQKSENPGLQRFEKAVSGMYLGRVLKAAFPEIDLDADLGAKGVVAFIEKQAVNSLYRESAITLLIRSTQFVAAQLFGLIKHYINHVDDSAIHFRFVCEGGLFWACSSLGVYADLVEQELTKLLVRSDYENLKVDICKIEQANLVGSAIAALTVQNISH